MKKRYLAAGIGALMLLLVLGLAVWAAPLVRTAFLMHGVSMEDGLQYKVSVKLEEGNLPEGQQQLAGMLSALIGEGAGQSWTMAGRARGGRLYGELYCEGISEPVTELYFCEGKGAVNVEMLYSAVQREVVKKYPLAQHVFPDWEYGTFLSGEQLEEVFQIDLEEMFQAKGMASGHGISAWEAFWTLAGMERSKGKRGGVQFGTSLGEYQASLEFAKEGRAPVVYLQAFDKSSKQKIAECTGEFAFQQVEEVGFPDSFLEEEDIKRLAKLWSAAQGLGGLF